MKEKKNLTKEKIRRKEIKMTTQVRSKGSPVFIGGIIGLIVGSLGFFSAFLYSIPILGIIIGIPKLIVNQLVSSIMIIFMKENFMDFITQNPWGLYFIVNISSLVIYTLMGILIGLAVIKKRRTME